MKVYEDQDWIRQLKQGSEQALDDLFATLYAVSKKGCAVEGLDEQVAYEVACQVYQRLVSSGIGKFDFRCKFSSYCFLIVSREIKRLERKYRRETVSVDDLEEVLADEGDPQAGQILKILQECLEKLNERDRNCILRFYLQGEDPADIAEALGISHTNVNVINLRARSQLKKCLVGRGYVTADDVLGSIISL